MFRRFLQDIWGRTESGHAKLEQAKSGQVRSGHVMSRHVKLEQVILSLNLAETVRKFGLLCGKFAAPSHSYSEYSYSEYSYSEYSYTAALYLNSPTSLPVCCVYTAHTHQLEV